MPHPPGGGIWNQLHEKVKTRQQSQQMRKTEKPEKSKPTVGMTESFNSLECINMPILKELKDKVKSSEGSGMETDQTEQLDELLHQSIKVVIKNHDTEETDDSMTSKQDIISEKGDFNLTSSRQQPEMTGVSKSIISPQKVAPSNADIPEPLKNT